MVTWPYPGIPTPFWVLQDTQEESGPGTLIFWFSSKFCIWYKSNHPNRTTLTFSGLLQVPPTFPNTSDFTPGNLTLTTQYHNHLQFHTSPLLITHPQSPPLPISQLGTSDYLPTFKITSEYPPTFTTTSNFIPGHSNYPSSFTTTSISHLGTTDYSLPFITTSNFTPGHIQLPTQYYHHLQFHTWAHPIIIHFPHHFWFHTSSNYHPLSPPLPISHLDTSRYPPNITTTYNFTPGHLWCQN